MSISGASDQPYGGLELELFAQANNWKLYWASQLLHHLKGAVLEVGAGIGSNTRMLRNDNQTRWVCLEPDTSLAKALGASIKSKRIPMHCEVVPGRVADLDARERFNAILYIDVLEHIDDDEQELARAAEHLAPNGKLIVLSPAHNALFSEFDKSIGHCRRYDKVSIAAAGPETLKLERLLYLDSFGLACSLLNRFILGQSLPTRKQLLLWDRVMIPVSRIVDRLLCYRFGKSVLAIWGRPSCPSHE